MSQSVTQWQVLGPSADFFATIENEGPLPWLVCSEDRSHSYAPIRARFDDDSAELHDRSFPHRLRPAVVAIIYRCVANRRRAFGAKAIDRPADGPTDSPTERPIDRLTDTHVAV